jgi:tetratricopeptide (TPR) repeat protein
MIVASLSNIAKVAGLAIVLTISTSGAVYAQKGGSTPKPKVDCSKAANKNKAACKNKQKLDDDELFHAGYWLSRDGRYDQAIEFLSQARNDADPRILTYLGFSHRKLGNTDAAMTFYARALAADANYTIARAYLGEAYLGLGDRAKAAVELREIATRCGTSCEEYQELAAAIAKDALSG